MNQSIETRFLNALTEMYNVSQGGHIKPRQYRPLMEKYNVARGILAEAARQGIVQCDGRDVGYKFYGEPTIHHARLIRAALNKRQREYLKEKKQKKTPKVSVFHNQGTLIQFTLEQHIAAVKSAGYKVMKPTTSYEEI